MITTVRDYLDARFGVHTYPRVSQDGVTLGVTPSRVLPQNAARLAFSFINLSPNVMWLTPIGTPSATKGFYLGPNGGTLNMKADDDGEVVAWEWLGVCAAAGSPYYTTEALLSPAGGSA